MSQQWPPIDNKRASEEGQMLTASYEAYVKHWLDENCYHYHHDDDDDADDDAVRTAEERERQMFESYQSYVQRQSYETRHQIMTWSEYAKKTNRGDTKYNGNNNIRGPNWERNERYHRAERRRNGGVRPSRRKTQKKNAKIAECCRDRSKVAATATADTSKLDDTFDEQRLDRSLNELYKELSNLSSD